MSAIDSFLVEEVEFIDPEGLPAVSGLFTGIESDRLICSN